MATVKFQGKSLKLYDFEVCDKDAIFKNRSAVYIFTKRNNAGVHTPLYIGESATLENRIANHEKWPCVEKHGCTHICVNIMVYTENSRLEMEADLLNAISTPCNKQRSLQGAHAILRF